MQCPNCDTKDQITIAGKTFCANCGTPASDTAQATASSAKTDETANSQAQELVVAPQPTPLSAEPSQQPAVQPVTSSDTTTDNPVLQPETLPQSVPDTVILSPPEPTANQATSFTRFHSPSTTALSAPVPAPQQVPGPTIQAPVIPVVDSLPVVPAPAGPPPPDDTTAAQAREAIANIQQSQPTANPVPAPMPPAEITSTPTPPVAPQPVEMPAEEPEVSTHTAKDENIGSELSSLDSQDEDVFSDEQLSELSNASSEITASRPTSYAPVKPMQDIRPGGSTQMIIQPTASANTNVFAAPVVPPVQNSLSNSMDSMSKATPSTPPVAGSVIKPTNSNTDGIDATAALAATSAASEVNTLLAQTQQAVPTAQPQQPNTPPKKQKKIASKIASVGLSMAGVILLGVYVWQINYPNLALKVAGSKAGISASLPSYMPSGWKVSGDIQANPGSIGYSLQSEDGSKKVSVSEDRTDWDSQALAENYLQSKTDNYTALQAQGLTIYLYNNQASWVNHGTWYRIEGDNHGLTQDQIIKMATSL